MPPSSARLTTPSGRWRWWRRVTSRARAAARRFPRLASSAGLQVCPDIADLKVRTTSVADLKVRTTSVADLKVRTTSVADLKVRTTSVADLKVRTTYWFVVQAFRPARHRRT